MYITNLNALLPEFDIDAVVAHYHPDSENKSKICCPFHEEKTPSFSISKSKNIATCFGSCGSYTPLNFIKEKENCGFVEAVEIAAKIHGLAVQHDIKKRSPRDIEKIKAHQEKRLLLANTNELVAKAYFEAAYGNKIPGKIQFKNDAQVRTLSKATVEKFGVCITNDEWDFIQGRFDQKLLLELGLIRENKKGNLYDVFRQKQLFPIHGKNNQIVGFAGRQLMTNKQYPKYINSSESSIYKKKEILYGLYPQANYIQKHGELYLAEGYWDVLTPYDLGFKGIVATCGTALTKEQVKLIKRFTSRVVYLADNDSSKAKNAGLEAVKKGMPLLLQEGLQAFVVLFPPNHDPDSFIREIGKEAFEEYINRHQQDAFLWFIEDAWEDSHKDGFAQDEIIKLAIHILVQIHNDTVLDFYSKQICKIIGITFSNFRVRLRDAQGEYLGNGADDNANGYTPEQHKSITRYRLYEKGRRTFCTTQKDDTVVANFIINPLFHLYSKENPKRLFEIVNEVGQKELIDTDTANLVSLDRFKNTIEEAGNFVFVGEKKHYTRLKRKMYDTMQTCYEINTLGYHNEGFYTFGNGIYTPKGEFIGVDDYGVVDYNKKQYFLPAFSSIYKTADEVYEEEKNFVYVAPKINFTEWAKLFCQVHGDNGKIAICFYLTALFRSAIQTENVKVPLMNVFGITGSGKSLFAENLVCMFGSKPKGTNIQSSTLVSLFNKLSLYRDGLVLIEEYKNAIPHSKIEACKSIWDGVGRERGQKTVSRNKTTPIRSTAIISGQELPTADPALFNRCISLVFSARKYSQKEVDAARKLKNLRGQLTAITAELFTLRDVVKERFNEYYREYSRNFYDLCKSENIAARMIDNNAVLAAIYRCLEDKLDFPFDRVEMFKVLGDNLFRQHMQVDNGSEISVFWSLVEYMSDSHQISEGSDFKVIYDKKDPNRRLLQIHFGKVHPLYLQYHRQQFNKQGLAKASILHYLQTHHTFVEKKKSVRFGKKNTSAFVFDYDMLGISITEEPESKSDEEIFDEAREAIEKGKAKGKKNK